jgi:hypothetical protein
VSSAPQTIPSSSGRARLFRPKSVGRSVAMRDAARGEPIARAGTRSNVRERSGARTLKGLFRPAVRLAGQADGAKREPIDTPRRRRVRREVGPAKRVGGAWVKARARLSSASPRRVKPKGAASGWRANPASAHQALLEGQKPRNRGPLGRPTASAAGLPMGQTVRGCFRAETRRIPSGKGRLRRVNPRSAAGVR